MSEYTEVEKKALDQILPDWGNEVEPISELTVARLDALSESAFELKAQIEEMERNLDKVKDIHKGVIDQIYGYMNHHQKDKYVCNLGTIGVVKKLSFTTPKTEQDKIQLCEFLETKGVNRYTILGVNSNTLNAMMGEYWNEEANTWKEKVPGIQDPKPYERVTLTKNK